MGIQPTTQTNNTPNIEPSRCFQLMAGLGDWQIWSSAIILIAGPTKILKLYKAFFLVTS